MSALSTFEKKEKRYSVLNFHVWLTVLSCLQRFKIRFFFFPQHVVFIPNYCNMSIASAVVRVTKKMLVLTPTQEMTGAQKKKNKRERLHICKLWKFYNNLLKNDVSETGSLFKFWKCLLRKFLHSITMFTLAGATTLVRFAYRVDQVKGEQRSSW